jgi:hypothetical protein
VHFAEDRWFSLCYNSREEAAAAHEDILHMINNNYIPSWVQNTSMSYNTSDWHGDIPF